MKPSIACIIVWTTFAKACAICDQAPVAPKNDWMKLLAAPTAGWIPFAWPKASLDRQNKTIKTCKLKKCW